VRGTSPHIFFTAVGRRLQFNRNTRLATSETVAKQFEVNSSSKDNAPIATTIVLMRQLATWGVAVLEHLKASEPHGLLLNGESLTAPS
jgi:hypothetical protein